MLRLYGRAQVAMAMSCNAARPRGVVFELPSPRVQNAQPDCYARLKARGFRLLDATDRQLLLGIYATGQRCRSCSIPARPPSQIQAFCLLGGF